MRVLLKEYGSYTNLPLEINSNILEIEEYSMTELLRKKYKPIGHLPLATEFKFIEIDLTHLVSYKNYECFEKQILARENIRRKRQAQEKKYNEKAKLIEEKKYEYYLRANLEVNMHRKTRLVPEWVTNTETKDNTWFTLDGKEIKAEKSQKKKVWEGTDEEIKHEEVKKEESEEQEIDEGVWGGFEIKPEEEIVEDFPVLGGLHSHKHEKIPIISSKKPKPVPKPKVITKTIKYKDDEGIQKELRISDADSQLFSTGNNDKFTLEQFMVVPSKDNRNRRKKKGKSRILL